MTTLDSRPAVHPPQPMAHSLGGDQPAGRQNGFDTRSEDAASTKTTGSRIPRDAHVHCAAGSDSRPTATDTNPDRYSSGGTQLAGRHSTTGTQGGNAAGIELTDRPTGSDAHTRSAVGASSRPAGLDSIPIRDALDGEQLTERHVGADALTRGASGANAEQGQAALIDAAPVGFTLLDPALALAADVLDDVERVRIANANRLQILTRSVEDSDGEVRGFGLDESHPDVARLAAMVELLGKVEHDAELNLGRMLRRHPLGKWVKAQKGIGEKQGARLLAAIGDPYVNSATGMPRTVSALWAYCGLHVLPVGDQRGVGTHTAGVAGRAQTLDGHPRPDTHRDHAVETSSADREGCDVQNPCVGGSSGGDPGHRIGASQGTGAGVAPKRARGQRANWSTRAKTKAYLVAMSCIKQLVKPCARDGEGPAVHVDACSCSAYRVVYDQRRAHTAVTRPDWTDGHSHNDAVRVAAKAILRDLWRAAREHHLAATS